MRHILYVDARYASPPRRYAMLLPASPPLLLMIFSPLYAIADYFDAIIAGADMPCCFFAAFRFLDSAIFTLLFLSLAILFAVYFITTPPLLTRLRLRRIFLRDIRHIFRLMPATPYSLPFSRVSLISVVAMPDDVFAAAADAVDLRQTLYAPDATLIICLLFRCLREQVLRCLLIRCAQGADITISMAIRAPPRRRHAACKRHVTALQ